MNFVKVGVVSLYELTLVKVGVVPLFKKLYKHGSSSAAKA